MWLNQKHVNPNTLKQLVSKANYLRMGGDQILEYPADITKFQKNTSPSGVILTLPPQKKKSPRDTPPCDHALQLYDCTWTSRWTKIDTSTLRFHWKLDQGLIYVTNERYITHKKKGFKNNHLFFYHFCHPILQLLPKKQHQPFSKVMCFSRRKVVLSSKWSLTAGLQQPIALLWSSDQPVFQKWPTVCIYIYA